MWSIIQIVVLLTFLEGILSIDNAAVLGAMVAHLPRDKAIPEPIHIVYLSTSTGEPTGP
mgnify:CR=1 FL=1